MDQMFQGKLPFSIRNGNRAHTRYVVFYRDEFEAEVREKMQLPFVKTAFLCFAFAELHRFGKSAKLPGLVGAEDFKRAAYWQLQALFLGGTSGWNDAEFMSDDYVMVLSRFLKSERRDLRGMFAAEDYCNASEVLYRDLMYERQGLGQEHDYEEEWEQHMKKYCYDDDKPEGINSPGFFGRVKRFVSGGASIFAKA